MRGKKMVTVKVQLPDTYYDGQEWKIQGKMPLGEITIQDGLSEEDERIAVLTALKSDSFTDGGGNPLKLIAKKDDCVRFRFDYVGDGNDVIIVNEDEKDMPVFLLKFGQPFVGKG